MSVSSDSLSESGDVRDVADLRSEMDVADLRSSSVSTPEPMLSADYTSISQHDLSSDTLSDSSDVPEPTYWTYSTDRSCWEARPLSSRTPEEIEQYKQVCAAAYQQALGFRPMMPPEPVYSSSMKASKMTDDANLEPAAFSSSLELDHKAESVGSSSVDHFEENDGETCTALSPGVASMHAVGVPKSYNRTLPFPVAHLLSITLRRGCTVQRRCITMTRR